MSSSQNFLTKSAKGSVLIAFVPVLHQGYVELFKKYPDDIRLLGSDIIALYTSLTRDLRIIKPELMCRAIEALGIAKQVSVLTKTKLDEFRSSSIVMPDEDVSRDLAAKNFVDSEIMFESIFLRWDKIITVAEHKIPPHRIISKEQFDQEMMRNVASEARQSSDWWRQNGAIILKDGQILMSVHNRHLPTDFHLAQNGDPRSNFDAGQRYDLSTAVHAEADAIARCAKQGLAVDGATLYCTTFPCVPCAKLICEAGIKKLYYQKGYSLLDSEDLLKKYGVEIVLVQDPERM